MKTFKLYVDQGREEKEMSFSLRRMVNAGYTGRDQDKVRAHIEELKKEGVPAPSSTPTAYEVISHLLFLDGDIEVVGDKTSGEAEFVLLCQKDEIYVGVGSDHTDRELEQVSIIKSKQVCPNVMSERVWKLREVEKEWDDLILRSWVGNDSGKRILYQEGRLAALMAPRNLLGLVKDALHDHNLDGVAVFSGTIPILTEKIHYSSYFVVELENPGTGRRLHCDYRVTVLDYLKGLRG
jgi:hypothetical protein